MFSEKDFERLWFLYKTEGEPKGVSINSFCISNNIPYTAFYDWFKKTQKKVVPVEVEDILEELLQAGNEELQNISKGRSKRTSPHKRSIMVTIRLVHTEKRLRLSGAENIGREIESLPENAVRIQISTAIISYCLVAIV